MLELKKLTVKFKFEGETHEVEELTIAELESIAEEAKKGKMSELDVFKRALTIGGLSKEVISKLSSRHVKEIYNELNAEKK